MFLGNLLSGIRNFVGGLTGGNRDEEERRRRQQQQPQRPQATVVRPLSLQEARSQAPGQLPQPTAQLTGGVKAPTLSKQDKELISKYNNPVNDKAFDRSRQVFNKILESPQNKDYEQAKRIAPYITQNKTQARLNRTLTETAKFAGDIAKTPVDVVQSAVKAPVMILNQLTGGKTELSPFAAKLLGEEDRRIGNLAEYGRQTRTGVSGALGRVSAQESGWDPLIGLGLSLLDLSPAAGVGLGLRTGIKEGAKSGLAQGIKSGTYRATGARNTLTQSDIGGVPEAEVTAGVRRLSGLERVTQEMPAPRDPTSPITVSPPSQKRPAITSGNPDFVPPELREVPPLQPAPIQVTRPEIGGTQAVTDLTEQLRRAEQTAPQQADEVAQAELARVQQAIDEQTVQPRPEPAPVAEAQVELPTTAQAREIAQATPPVAPEIIEQTVKAEAARQAPTEVPPAPEGAVAPVSTGAPKVLEAQAPEQIAIATADKQTTDIIKQANAALASEKKSYGDLVVKLARNNEPGAVPKTLTPAENKIYSEIKPQLDAIVLKMNKLGLTDEDMGWLRQYLPTAKADELGAINSIEDVARREFGFTLRRENKLSDEQVKQGAEQALRDYLRTGQLLDYLDTDVVDSVKVERLSNDINNMIEQGYQDKPTGMKLTDDEITEMRQENANFVEKQRALVNAQRVVDEGDMSDEAISARNAAEKEAEDTLINKRVNDYLRLERKTDEKIAEINNSNLSPVQKIKAKNNLEAHLAVVRNQTYYLQSATRTNMLLGVGRIADQINKATQATADTLTGAISKTGAGRQFKKDVGRDLFADGSTAGAVWNKIKNTPGLNQSRFNLEVNRRIVQQQTAQKGALAKLGGKYRVFGTRLTEAGSRYQRPAKDVTSYFVAKGKAEGITDINDLARYVEDAVGTSEWNRVYGQMYDIRNRFTGVPTFTRDVNGTLISGNRNIKLNIRQGIYSALGNVPGLSRNVRDNIADAITIPVFGFPALVARLGVRGFEHATGGVTDFIRAANIKPVNEAQALERALLVKRGLDSAQTGPALYALGIGLGAAGLTTGAYPEDKAEQKRWESEQIQPYSIKIGDVYVDPSRYIGPLAFPLMLGTSLGSGRFTEEAPQAIGNIIKQISQNYGADNIADIMETAAKLMKGDLEGAWQNGLSNWTSGIINAFVPGASLLNTAGKLTDEVRRETGTTLTDKLAGKFPGTRQTLPVKTDAFGNPIQQGGLMNLFPAVTGGQGATRTPVTEELNRLAQAGVEAYPGTTAGTGKNVKLKNQLDEDIKLTSQQQASLNAAVKKEKENQALLVMSSETYQSATDEEKGNLLKKVYGLDSAAAASQWAQDNGIKGVKQTSEKVNNNLPVESQQALLEYRLQGDKGKVWLDDFNNAARYYNAAYENAKLNGTLTRKDDSLQNKNGLRYKAVVAKIDAESGVTPDIKDLYSTVTVSEWRKLADPENDAYDPDLAARLFAYDELRTKAGVSLGKYTDKPKYSQKAGGGRGGRGSDRFAFATLPSSLMGTTAAVGAGYDKGERLFKPIPDLQAPPTVVIPKGRSISVKRGVQL